MTIGGAIRSGLRALAVEPELLPAELAWRGSLGLALLFLTLTAGFEFFHAALARPDLWLGFRPFLDVTAILLVGFLLLSGIAHAAGRNATAPALFRRGEARGNFSALVGIGILRAALRIVTVMSVAGMIFFGVAAAGGRATGSFQSFGEFFLLFFVLPFTASLVYVGLDRFLSLAALYAVRNNTSLEAIASSVALLARAGGVLAGIELLLGSLGAAVVLILASGVLASLPLMRHFPLFTLVFLAVLFSFYALASASISLCRLGAYAAVIGDGGPGSAADAA